MLEFKLQLLLNLATRHHINTSLFYILQLNMLFASFNSDPLNSHFE